jgi:hypothetical protein
MDTQKLLDEACPMIGEFGWAYYFDPTTAERGQRLGLDVFEFYFLGRGGVLGDVEATVVQSAFGYFNPAVLAAMWESGRAKVAPRTAGREYLEAAHDFGRAKLAGVEGLGPFVESAKAVVAAGRGHVEGLTLFAAASSEPVPTDAPAAAMHQLSVLRELRGSAHLLAVVAEGLLPRTAHQAKRPEMWTVFGWSDDDRPAVTEEDRSTLARAEDRTDQLVTPAFDVLDDDGAAALLTGLRGISAALSPATDPGA